MRFRNYWQRLKGQRSAPLPRVSVSTMLWSWLGAFCGIALVGVTHRWIRLSDMDQVLLIGSFGASAVLVYGAPHLPLSQPRNLIGGHLVSALTGVFFTQTFFTLPLEITAAVAVASAIFLMHLTKTLHPPGGATALIAVIGSEHIQRLGYAYILQPVLSGGAIMLLVALLINNLSSNPRRHYPQRWW